MAKRKTDKSADWNWLTTPPDSKINLPTVTRIQDLDFGSLTWENFEKLCFRLASLEADVEHCQLYGVRGQSQKGIDIYARIKSDNSFTVYQCKRENDFTAGKIIKAVDTFRVGTWANKADRFVLCTKESLIETQLADEIETQREILKKEKVFFVIWGSVQLSEKLKDLPELVDEFFGREWVRVFCGEDAAARLGEKFDQSVFDDYMRAVKRFSADTPHLALNETLTGKRLLLDEIYVPLPFSAPEVSRSKSKTPMADARAGENSGADDGKTNSISTLADVLSYAAESGKPVLLQGVGGAGKSTVLHRVAHDAWDAPAAIGLPAPFLPILVRLPVLAAVREFSLPKLLIQSLRDGNDLTLNGDLPENFFDAWSRHFNAKWMVMFDGLDEVAAERRADALQRLKHLVSVLTEGGHLAVVTSRPASGDEEFRRFGEKSVIGDLLPFDDAQQKDFAVRWFGDRADDFLVKVQRFVKSGTLFREPLALTPLLLTIAAAVYEAQGDLPEAGENELYREFINVLFKKAEQRGLKDELRDEVFDVARSALEEMALAMTDRPEENTFNDLEKVCADFLRRELPHYTVARARKPAHDLCEVLTRRSGILFKQGKTCQWVHATMREYLAAVALDRRIKDGGGYETTVGARIGESKNDELLIAFGKIHDDKRTLVLWLTGKAQTEKSSKAAVFAYDIWDECDPGTRDELHTEIILALACGFGDANSGRYLRDVSKNLLVEMGERAVEPLLNLLGEMNGVQEKLLPEWDDQGERPDIHEESGRQIYQADRIRRKIIKTLGEIGDERAIELLVSLLPQQVRFDSYRYYVAQAARRALLCIGERAIAPIIACVIDSTNSTKERCDYFAGLTSIGIRTDEASETVRQCLEEGLIGNKEILNFSIRAAVSLRDRSQAGLVKQALASDNLDTLEKAALYFELMPDESAVAELESALQECLSRPEEKPFWSSWTIKTFAATLLASRQKHARNLILEFVKNNLPGNDKIHAHSVIEILGNSDLSEAPGILLIELDRRFKSPSDEKPNDTIDSLLREIIKIWRPEASKKLASVAVGLLNKPDAEKNFTDCLVEIHTEPPSVGEGESLPLRSRVSFENVLKILAKCRIPNFGTAVTRLLPVSVWSATFETCDALWLAGDSSAENALIEKLRQLTTARKTKKDRKDDEHPGTDEYYIIRALGTCAVSERGVETVLDYMRENPRLSRSLPYDVLRTLLRRGAVTAQRIAEIALDRDGTHEYARNFCLQALCSFDAPRFTAVFLDAFCNETDEEAKGSAAFALGWANKTNRATAISALENELTGRTSAYIAINIGESLARLKSSESLPLIEAAINRFGIEKMPDLLASAAEFRAASTFKMLPDIFDEKWHYSDREARNIAAFGFFYQTEDRARANVRARFEAALKCQDTGKQRHAVYALAVHDPAWLLERAIGMFDEKTLESSAKLAVIFRVQQISHHKSSDAENFVRLYARLLCDRDLTVRESAAASLANVNSKLRQQIYDALYTCDHDWARGCAVYSLGFWDSDAKEIERACFDVSKTVRFLAGIAKTIRDKRAALKKTIHTFKESAGGSERVAAYFALAEQAEMSHVETLYRSISYEHPAHLFLNDLEKDVEKRVEAERKKRAKDEEELLCQSARFFDVPFSNFSFKAC